jgi:hypothetical protein
LAAPARYVKLIRRTTAGGKAREREGGPGRGLLPRYGARRMRLLAATGALLLALTACGGGSSSSNSASTTTSSTNASSSSSTASPEATLRPATGGSTTPVSVAPTQPAAHLVAVRTARQETVDRVVFEFADRVPGYRVSYVKKPVKGTSGQEVPLSEDFVLEFHMQQASGFNQDAGRPTYTGPKELKAAGTRAVGEVKQVEDFEAVLTWVAGLKTQAPFRVSALSSPPRLVIDLSS